jgi:cytochrome c6
VNMNLKIAGMACLALTLVVPAMAQDSGAQIYKDRCTLCHGDDGKSTTPTGKAFNAASFTDPAAVKASDQELITIVTKGKGKMMAFGGVLTDDQIKAVVAYIRTLQKKP